MDLFGLAVAGMAILFIAGLAIEVWSIIYLYKKEKE